jgi:5-methylcytosine-specific restriction endonuclease McrA
VPTRLCLAPRCGRPQEYRGYCEVHKTQRNRETTSENKAVYNSARWKYLRRSVLFAGPLCAADGCDMIATDVDHIVPLPKGDAWARSNLQALCKRHHSQKTRIEQGKVA